MNQSGGCRGLNSGLLEEQCGHSLLAVYLDVLGCILETEQAFNLWSCPPRPSAHYHSTPALSDGLLFSVDVL